MNKRRMVDWECKLCGSKKKSFYKDVCRKCYQNNFIDKEKRKAKDKRYKTKHKNEVQERINKWYELYPEKKREYWEKSYKNSKEKILNKSRGHYLDNFEKYKKIRASWYKYHPFRCLICSSENNILLHHFTKPYNLDKVVPLCKKCHIKVHRNNINFTEEDYIKCLNNKFMIIDKGWMRK